MVSPVFQLQTDCHGNAELSSDPTIRSHLTALYDTLLEQNLLRIVEPYSVVEISYVAETVGQERQAVEDKPSQMILDKVLYGVLDQGRGCLIVYDQPQIDVSVHMLFTNVHWSLMPGFRIPMVPRLVHQSKQERSWNLCMLKSVILVCIRSVKTQVAFLRTDSACRVIYSKINSVSNRVSRH